MVHSKVSWREDPRFCDAECPIFGSFRIVNEIDGHLGLMEFVTLERYTYVGSNSSVRSLFMTSFSGYDSSTYNLKISAL